MRLFDRGVWISGALWALLALSGCSNGGDSDHGHHQSHQGGEHSGEQTSHQEEGDSHKAHEGHEGHNEQKSGHAEKGHESQALHLTKEQASLLNIEIGQAGAGDASDVLTMPATVRFDADRTARIGPRLEAKVVKVLVDLGERVSAGTELAVMDSVTLGRAKSELLSARARLEAAQARYRREKSLAKDKISSEAELLAAQSQFRQARAARDAAREALKLYGLSSRQIDRVGERDAPLSRFALTASLDGIVQRRDLSPGETLSSDRTPIHIVDNRRMWIMIHAYERALSSLQPGQSVTFTSRALPGERFAGKLDWVSLALDGSARTLPARAVADNPEGLLRAGMTGQVQVQTSAEARTAMVPVDAIQRLDGQPVVFVPGDESGAYRALAVTLGDEGNGLVEIRNGLKPGDAVVTAGAFDLMSALTASTRSAAHSH